MTNLPGWPLRQETLFSLAALFLLTWFIAACGTEETATPQSTATSTSGPVATPTAQPTEASTAITAGAQPTAAPGAVSAATPIPISATTPTPSFLTILEPTNESIVEVSPITIRGQTITDSIISMNGELAEVDATGNFSIQVALEEGPNVFDVSATDAEGNEAASQFTVFFSPAP